MRSCLYATCPCKYQDQVLLTQCQRAQARAEGEIQEWKDEGRDEGGDSDIEATCAASASTGHRGGRGSGGEGRKGNDNGSAVETVGECSGRAVGCVEVAVGVGAGAEGVHGHDQVANGKGEDGAQKCEGRGG